MGPKKTNEFQDIGNYYYSLLCSNRFPTIIEYCREKGIIIIEDCAHTLGGKIGGEAAGTLEMLLFWFNYDKPISLGWGGAMIITTQNLI